MNTRVLRPLRILDIDSECRPLSYMGMDYTSGEITAIAASWIGEKRVHCWLLGRHTPREMLSGFLDLYNQADLVTGHYLRKHDLPIISGALLEFGLGVLPPKLCSDTCLDLVKHKYLSASQESLSGMFELPRHKHHMSQPQWREANRLTEKGMRETRKRVADDVRQHVQLRERLIEAEALKPPRVWAP